MMSHIESQVGQAAAAEVDTPNTADWWEGEEAGTRGYKAINCSVMARQRNAHPCADRRTKKRYPA